MNSVKLEKDQAAPTEIPRTSRLLPVRIPMTIRYAALLASLLVLWQAYVAFVDRAMLPGLPEVAVAFWDGWVSGRLATATWTAVGVLAIAMLFGAALAAFLAVFAIRTRVGDDLLGLLAFALGPIPAVAVLPLLVVLFGAGTDSLILVSLFAVVLPLARDLRTGLGNVNPTLVMIGHNLGLRGWRTLIATGLVFGIAGEGQGFFTDDAGNLLAVPDLLASLLTIALAGILAETAFGLLERRTVKRWGMDSGPR